MRVNLVGIYSTRKYPGLVQHWTRMLAEEYHVETDKAAYWIIDPDARDFVTEFLRSKGWIVTSYTTPPIDNGNRCISRGFVIDDECDAFVQFKLSQP